LNTSNISSKALSITIGPDTQEDQLFAELNSNKLSLRRRRALLRQLGRFGSERSVEVLQDNLRHRDIRTKAAAVAALGEIGTDEAATTLGEFLLTQNGSPFAMAAYTLRRTQSSHAMPLLLDALEKRPDLGEAHKRVLIHELAHFPHRSQIPALAEALRSKSIRTRHTAAMALSGIRAPDSRATLAEAAQSLSWFAGLPVRRELRRLPLDPN
jgi:HEAT repeat protein